MSKEKFEAMRHTFGAFYVAVKAAHEAGADRNRGHDLLHDVTVAQHALSIAPNDTIAEQAWVASMCHSQDYLVRDRSKSPGENAAAFDARVEELLTLLPNGYFMAEQVEDIHTAAVRHQEKNDSRQGIVQQVLQDADRLTNLMEGVQFRIGQGYPRLPAFELEHLEGPNPASTYAEPRSCADDLRLCISEYWPQFRMPRARGIASRYIDHLNHCLMTMQMQYERLGIAGMTL
jgi:hypothetical protein